MNKKKLATAITFIILAISPFITYEAGHHYGYKKATEYNLALVENTIKTMNRKTLAMNKE